LETPVAPTKKTSQRAAVRKKAPATGELKTLAGKQPFRTLLVASCGWPTDAALPDRKRPTRG
jgi:hypothetical protein